MSNYSKKDFMFIFTWFINLNFPSKLMGSLHLNDYQNPLILDIIILVYLN
jgi:hypothetical protein